MPHTHDAIDTIQLSDRSALPAGSLAVNRGRSGDRSTAFLDGLRGLAALFVFIQHYIGGFDANVHDHGFGEDGNYYIASLPFLRIIWNGGNAGVAIFFILSGYVLSKAPLRLFQNGKYAACKRSLISAAIRRPLRLYLPPIAVALVFALLMHVPGPLVEEVPWSRPKETLLKEIVNWATESVKFFNPFQSHGSDKQWYTYNLVAWTLPIELKGSMLVYGLVFPYAISGWISLLSLLLLGFASFMLLLVGQWSMACFIMGLLLCFIDTYSLDKSYVLRRVSPSTQSALWNVCFFVGWYLLSQPAHAGSPEYSRNTPGWYHLHNLIPSVYTNDKYYRFWQSWGALLLVYGTLRVTWIQRFLNIRSLRYLGKVSFMMYLVHLGLFRIYGDRISRMLGNVWTTGDQHEWWDNRLYVPDVGPAAMSTRFLLSVAIVLPITLYVSDVGTKLIDTPSLKLAKALAIRAGLDQGGPVRIGQTYEPSSLPIHG